MVLSIAATTICANGFIGGPRWAYHDGVMAFMLQISIPLVLLLAACFFGWPNLTNTPTGGYLGLPGGGPPSDMQVVDVYRQENGRLAENWVFIDHPWWLKQQGLDILERTQQILNP